MLLLIASPSHIRVLSLVGCTEHRTVPAGRVVRGGCVARRGGNRLEVEIGVTRPPLTLFAGPRVDQCAGGMRPF